MSGAEWIFQDALGFSEAAGTVKIFQGGERVSDQLLGSGDEPPKRLLLCRCAAGEPHTDVVCEYALYGEEIEGQKQFLGEAVLPEDPQEVKSLLC